MKADHLLLHGPGLARYERKSRWPAKLDIAQGVSGLLLAIFMWAHMLFVSSILISKDAMYTVTKAFEGRYLFGEARPWLVSLVVACVLLLFVLHAALAMRKFPSGYQQSKIFIAHQRQLKHGDTRLWFVQVVTGFVLLFLGSAHLVFMLVNPDQIGPYQTADRVWGGMWPIYLLLLFAVELHGGIGLYRLAVKWNWFQSEHGDGVSRQVLRRVMWGIIVGLISLGLVTLAVEMNHGYQHREQAGEQYQPVVGDSVQDQTTRPPAQAAG
jgi:fumarate reductase subunit C